MHPSDYPSPVFNGSYPPPGEEVPTDFRSFFEFGDTPPPSPSKVKNFFGSLRNRAKSNPDNDGEFKTRQRSRTNPFDDRNKLRGLLDSWNTGSKSKETEPPLFTAGDVPPVPKLPDVLKQPRIRMRPLDIETCQVLEGGEPWIAIDDMPQTPLNSGFPSPIDPDMIASKASLKPSPPLRRFGTLADATNSPDRSTSSAPRPSATQQIFTNGSTHLRTQSSGTFSSRTNNGVTMDSSGTVLTPPTRGSSLDVVRSQKPTGLENHRSPRTPWNSSSFAEPIVRAPSGEAMLGVFHPRLEPIAPISPFGVSFPAPADTDMCTPHASGQIVSPVWSRGSVDPVHPNSEGPLEQENESDTSPAGSPEVPWPEEGDLAGDLSMWWGSEGAYYYDSRSVEA
ncbi:hypothetical protein FRB90_011107 [Tulasnella sp. 427]|nr:hypothetical protein FRB90_011107 [Tulasnella sp. 427]